MMLDKTQSTTAPSPQENKASLRQELINRGRVWNSSNRRRSPSKNSTIDLKFEEKRTSLMATKTQFASCGP